MVKYSAQNKRKHQKQMRMRVLENVVSLLSKRILWCTRFWRGFFVSTYKTKDHINTLYISKLLVKCSSTNACAPHPYVRIVSNCVCISGVRRDCRLSLGQRAHIYMQFGRSRLIELVAHFFGGDCAMMTLMLQHLSECNCIQIYFRCRMSAAARSCEYLSRPG